MSSQKKRIIFNYPQQVNHQEPESNNRPRKGVQIHNLINAEQWVLIGVTRRYYNGQLEKNTEDTNSGAAR